MQCPSCNELLPFYFAFSSAGKKLSCPSCQKVITPTEESSNKIQRLSIIVSFIAGIPLGGICSYFWIIVMQPVLAFIVLLAGVIGVVGSTYTYSASNMRFHLHSQINPESF